MKHRVIVTFFLFLMFFTPRSLSAQTVPLGPPELEPLGVRPYEMTEAGRNENPQTPLVDFENLDDWTVELRESEASFHLSRLQQLWGEHVGHLRYKKVGDRENAEPLIVLRPKEPIPLPMEFDCVDFWIYGNNWEWVPVTTIPRVKIVLLFRRNDHQQRRIELDTVRWQEWFLVHRRFSVHELASLGEDARLEGIEIRGGTNTVEAELFFDDLCFYKERLDPLVFTPCPKRPITYPPHQTTGTNTGEGFLPFPNREETILPESKTETVPEIICGENSASLILRDKKGTQLAQWNYEPQSGTLDDFEALIQGIAFRSHGGSQIVFADGSFLKREEENLPPKSTAKAKFVALKKETEKSVSAYWQYTYGERTVDAKYVFQVKGNSLIVDFECASGVIREISLGIPKLQKTSLNETLTEKAYTVPYLTGNGGNRPKVRLFFEKSIGGMSFEEVRQAPILCHLATIDHTRSNASGLFFNVSDPLKGEGDGVVYNMKTDATRNACYERFFFTFVPSFAEVLPTIPNPASPWKHVTAGRVWRAHHSSNHESDYAYWKNVHRHGIRNIIINDHETMWRDGGESFTFRTSAAPKKGGDVGQLEYTKKLHALGFYYGPYNNYTDYAPVNAYWNPDWVTRLSDGNYRSAWARCYNPKPQIAVQAEQEIAEIVQRKFGFNTAYCDVHTAVSPWHYVDYDARVPGAGTFAASFYAYGEILLHQKKTWNGPVYSEGNNHWYYSGLSDGNYAQDSAYFKQNPDAAWIVDFDLLKIHPLENNFGMGNIEMFFGKTQQEFSGDLDRFIAATLAFGHAGFFEQRHGIHHGARSYFLVQPVAERAGTQNVETIRYGNEKGELFTTEQALATGVIERNHITTWYDGGLVVFVNGNQKEYSFNRPPNSFFATDLSDEFSAFSVETISGCRFDYAETHETLYADARGQAYRHDFILCNGPVVVRKNTLGSFYLPEEYRDKKDLWEVIPIRSGPSPCTILALALPGFADAEVIPVDAEGNVVSVTPQEIKRYSHSDGMLHLFPHKDVFSYVLKPGTQMVKDAVSVHLRGTLRGVPWETLFGKTVTGNSFVCEIPLTAEPNTIHWSRLNPGTDEEKWVGMLVVPLCYVKTNYSDENHTLSLDVFSNLSRSAEFQVALEGLPVESQCETLPGDLPVHLGINQPEPHRMQFKIPAVTENAKRNFTLKLSAKTEDGDTQSHVYEKRYQLETVSGFRDLGTLEDHCGPEFTTGHCMRNATEIPTLGGTGATAYRDVAICSGNSRDAWILHPPYQGGTGYVYLLSDPFTLPETPGGIELDSFVGIRDGGDKSDGIVYKVIIVQENGDETEVVSQLQTQRPWTPLVADLSPWAGQKVRIKLLADAGTHDNPNADWGCWTFPKIRGKLSTWNTSLRENKGR